MEPILIHTFFGNVFAWMNANQGALTFLIFAATIAFGWASGIFSALRMRPRLDVRLIDGPTFSCTFPTGGKHGSFDEHCTGIALYLHISNQGSIPTGIAAVELGYHWHLRPLSFKWWRYSVGWFWLTHQSVALTDFHVMIGSSIKVYPFLTQLNHLSPARSNTYLRTGEATNGVVYFEQQDSWGGCFPKPLHGFTKIKLRLHDGHGHQYTSKHRIPVISIDEARKYNPRFGETNKELRSGALSGKETQTIAEEYERAVHDSNVAQ